jgi:hypothetical protein
VLKFLKKNRKNKKQPFNTKDVIFSRKNKVVCLKERTFNIEISRNKIKEFFEGHRPRFVLIGVVVILIAGVGYFLFPSRADVAYFYPTSCLGGWGSPQNAQGQPNVELGASIEAFNTENSAILRNAVAQIFCAGFEVNAPENSQPIKVVLKLSWLIKSPAPENNPTATSTDVLIPEFPLISPTPTSTEIIIPPTPENSLPLEEVLETTPSLEPSATATIEPTLEITLEPTSVVEPSVHYGVSPTPTIEITPEITPESTPSPTLETTPEISPTPLSFWKKIFLPALAQEILVTPTPEITPESTPVPTFESTITPAIGLTLTPTPELTITPTPNPTPEPTLTPTPSTAESTLPSGLPSNQAEKLISEPTASAQENETVLPTSEVTEEPTPAASPEVSLALDGREPPANFLQISYTLDGSNWNQLARINFDNWQNLEIEIPVFSWEDLANLQIGIQTLPTVDLLPDIYLDGIFLRVEYDFYDAEIIIEETPEEEVLDDSLAADSERVSLDDLTHKPLTIRNLYRNISIDPQATHNCQIEPFRINVSEGLSFPAKIILQKSGANLEELEIGSLPAGINVVFPQNSGYLYYPGLDEKTVDLEVINEEGSQKGSFSISVIYTKKGDADSTITGQMNIVNF